MVPSAGLTRHHCVILDGPPHDHDGVVERALSLLNKLLRSSTQDQRARLGLRAAGEQVEPAAKKQQGIYNSMYYRFLK